MTLVVFSTLKMLSFSKCRVQVYSLREGKWRSVAPFPMPVFEASIVPFGDTFLVLGKLQKLVGNLLKAMQEKVRARLHEFRIWLSLAEFTLSPSKSVLY